MTQLTIPDLTDSFTDIFWKAIRGPEPLSILSLDKREYLALANAQKMSHPRKVILSTIHGVKGMEADWVVILTDMSGRTWQSYSKDPEAERRVWYVATTRTKFGIIVVAPQSTYYFTFPR